MIDRDELEAKAGELEEALLGAGESLRSKAAMGTAGVAAGLILAYLTGRRRGRSKGARIEIHRL